MSTSLGQIAPIAIALLCLAALFLYLRRPYWAGAATALAMVEPHLALPSCIALFLAFRRERASLLMVAILLLAVSAALGVDRNVEYMTQVLPSHALSDVSDVGQFSLTAIAHVLGSTDRGAYLAGSIWYAISACCGITLAYRFGREPSLWPLVAVLPAVFAVFGGPYVHWQQVVGALPAALILLHHEKLRPALLVTAIIGVAIPWLYVTGWGFFIPGAAAVAGLLTTGLAKRSWPTAMAVSVGVLGILLLINHALPHAAPTESFTALVKASAWADSSWGEYVRARIPIGSGLYFWLHMPTWISLAAIALFAVRAAFRTRPTPATARQGA